MKISIKRILLISSIATLIFSSCSTNTVPINLKEESFDQIAAAVTQLPALTPIPTMTPIQAIDVSGWVVTVGSLKCALEPSGDEYPGWYMADCPEQLWFPIGQTTTLEINSLDSETCAISPIDNFEIAIRDITIDALPVEFTQIEDAQWGCQISYSDTAGIEVVCGLEVDCEEFDNEKKVIIFGRTIRVNSGGDSGGGNENGNGGSQSSSDDSPPPHFGD
jgi:hypothetical protein